MKKLTTQTVIIAIVLGAILSYCLPVHARLGKPSAYTKQKMRTEKARQEHERAYYRADMERMRIRNNELRRQDAIKNQRHNELMRRKKK